MTSNKEIIKEFFDEWHKTLKEEDTHAMSIDKVSKKLFSVRLAKENENNQEYEEPTNNYEEV